MPLRCLPRLLLVTDPAYVDARIEEVVDTVGDALPPGEFGVQLRDKQRAKEAVAALARRLRKATAARGVPLMINGDLALAREVGAEGVHFGENARGWASLARRVFSGWITVPAHSDADVVRAREEGADAVLVSPIFATPGKGTARGLSALEGARTRGGSLAIYALGGVDATRARQCVFAGATGVAVLRALLGAKDPVKEARAIFAALQPSARNLA